MRREQAVALVKELVGNNLIQTTWLLIEKRTPDSYQLKFKGDWDHCSLDDFLKNRNLSIEENKEKQYLVIFKP